MTIKETIDQMSFTEMLRMWRTAPVGHEYFCGETGEYFEKVFKEKRAALTPQEFVRISKQVSW